jgi:hypothetical protein
VCLTMSSCDKHRQGAVSSKPPARMTSSAVDMQAVARRLTQPHEVIAGMLAMVLAPDLLGLSASPGVAASPQSVAAGPCFAVEANALGATVTCCSHRVCQQVCCKSSQAWVAFAAAAVVSEDMLLPQLLYTPPTTSC